MYANVTQVSSAETLARGLSMQFTRTYETYITGVNKRLELVMDLSVPSDKYEESYAYYESAPHPRRWVRGQPIPSDAFGARSWNVVNHDWGLEIPWHANDEDDDQLGGLVDQARQGGQNFAILDERLFFQVLIGSTDLDLLPAVPNAPDGVGLFNGAARFGHASGNIVTGTGVATVSAIQTDLYAAIARGIAFQDTKGQPLLPPEILRRVVVVFGSANLEIFERAFQQRFHLAPATAVAAVSNVIMDAAFEVILWPTPRITDNDWFVFFVNHPRKAVFKQVRQPLRDNIADFTNSDRTRQTKVKALSWDSRAGYGVTLPHMAIQVNN